MKSLDGFLDLIDTPEPQLQENEALIKVTCFGVSCDDVYRYRIQRDAKMYGTDFSGVVVKVNSLTESSFKAGDRVLGYVPGGGAMAEFVACSLSTLSLVPAGVSMVDAASLPDSWFTAYQVLKKDAPVAKRERIAVFDAMSPRGQATVKLAQLIGCRRVHCVANSSRAHVEGRDHLKLKAALFDEVIVHKNDNTLYNEIATYDPKGLEAAIFPGALPTRIYPEMFRPLGRIVMAPSSTLMLKQSSASAWIYSLKPHQHQLLFLKSLQIKFSNIRGKKDEDFQEHQDFFVVHILPKVRSGKLKCSTKLFNWENAAEAFKFAETNPESKQKVICSVGDFTI